MRVQENEMFRLITNSGNSFEFEVRPAKINKVFTDHNGLSTSKLLNFLECQEDFLFIVDSNYKFTYVNHALLDLWGVTREQAIGNGLEFLQYPPDLQELHDKQMEFAFQGNIIRGENGFTDSEGNERHFENIFVPLYSKDGTINEIGDIAREITKRKKTRR